MITLDSIDLTNLTSDAFQNQISKIRNQVSTDSSVAGIGFVTKNLESRILLPLFFCEHGKEIKTTLEITHFKLYVEMVHNSEGQRYHILDKNEENEEGKFDGEYIDLPDSIRVDYPTLFVATKDNSTPRLMGYGEEWSCFEDVPTDLEAIKLAVRHLSFLNPKKDSFSISDTAFSLLTLFVGVIEPLRSNSVEMKVRRSIGLGLKENPKYLPLHSDEWIDETGMRSVIYGWGFLSYVVRSACRQTIAKGRFKKAKVFDYYGNQITSPEQAQHEVGLIKDEDLIKKEKKKRGE